VVRTRILRLEDLRELRKEILRITARHGARNVRVFGSVARGQARIDSDIDLLVEFEPGRTVLDLSSLILDLRDALDCEVNVVEVIPGTTSSLVERIEREAVPL
jgi:predicted nucleotidyltransferase